MKLNKFKRAFSLTELMIVLVIIAVLFAAMAPIMTKRHNGVNPGDSSVWHYVNDDAGRDAYFDGQMPKEASAAYIGLDGSNIPAGEKTPYSKVILRANANQSYIQFRYGSGKGILAGVFKMNNKGSLVSGTTPVFMTDGGQNNTVAGAGAMQYGSNSNNNVAVGSYALQGNVDCRDKNNCATANMNVAIGTNSGLNYTKSSTSNVFLGSGSGMGINISDTVAAGSNTLGMLDSKGKGNVYAGTYVASSGFNTDDSNGNTILGSMYSGNKGSNTIIGYNTYLAHYPNSGHPKIDYANVSKMTAVGYLACSGVGAGSIDTCIGYQSAQHTGVGTQDLFINDKAEHIYIGGSPEGFGGRSVLEVHNFVAPSHSKSYKPDIGPTVIMNSHLVVRGNVFFPDNNGVLRPHSRVTMNAYNRIKDENSRDDCCRLGGLFGHRQWRDPSNCGWSWWGKVGLAALDVLSLGSSIIVANVISYAVGLTGSWFGPWTALFGAENKTRLQDPISFSAVSLDQAPSCYGKNSPYINYPTANSNCPDLQLSDVRLKENITDNNDSIEKLLLIMPYNYTFKADKAKTPQVGVIAQDLQKYSPISVSEGDDGYLRIRWDEIFYVTINSIKSLNTKLTSISNDSDKLQADINVVAKEQNNVQKRIDALNKRVNKLEK